MIIFDTNVISEPLQTAPNPLVLNWIARHDDDSAITAITAGELLFGACGLPEGRRRETLSDGINHILSEYESKQAILPFDLQSAEYYASISAYRRSIGKPISVTDAQIAAICLSHEAVLATRNAKDFVNIGLEIKNPWDKEEEIPNIAQALYDLGQEFGGLDDLI